MSILTVSFDVSTDLAERAAEVLTSAGFATRMEKPKPDTVGALVVVECWFDNRREIRALSDRAAGVLSGARIPVSKLSPRIDRGTVRGVRQDGRLLPSARVTGINEEEWSRNLDVLAVERGIDRSRLSLDPEDDPFRRLIEGE
jgi:hypothetical protein